MQFRGFTASDPQIWHEGAEGSSSFKDNIEIENNATTVHLLCRHHWAIKAPIRHRAISYEVCHCEI